MRLVQVTVEEDVRADALDVLEDEGIDYVVTPATEDPDYAATIFFPLPTEAVDPVLDALYDVGLAESGHSVIVSAETVVSEEYEEYERAFESSAESGEQVARAELVTQARESIPKTATFLLLSAVSAVVGTAGLLLDSPAVVVGSMVIAPLIGPMMATGVGTVLTERDLFRDGVKHQVVGLAVVLVSATLFAAAARTLFLVPPTVDILGIEQIAGRTSPDLLTLAVAIGSGVAGARSLAADVSTGLVGVMIAAALVPPAAAVGIGIAWGLPSVVFKAGLLVLVNTLSINLAALATLWYSGNRPSSLFTTVRAKLETRQRLLALAVGVLVLTAVLVTFTATAYRDAATAQDVTDTVEGVLDGPAYEELALVDTEVHRTSGTLGFRSDVDRVVVRVTRPDGTRYPDLADRLATRIERRTGRAVVIQVRYVDVSSSRSPDVG